MGKIQLKLHREFFSRILKDHNNKKHLYERRNFIRLLSCSCCQMPLCVLLMNINLNQTQLKKSCGTLKGAFLAVIFVKSYEK